MIGELVGFAARLTLYVITPGVIVKCYFVKGMLEGSLYLMIVEKKIPARLR